MQLGKEIRELDVDFDDELIPPQWDPASKPGPVPEPQQTP
jgi:hypothetical protein